MYKQSIVILYHKYKEQLLYSLSLLKETVSDDVEILIFGNNDNKNELDFILEQRFKYIQYPKSLLYSKAVNMAVELAQGEIITLMDQDIFVLNDWYTPLLNMLLSSHTIGAVSSKMLNPTTGRIIEYGIEFNTQNTAHIGKDLKKDNPLTCKDIKVSAACSGVMMTWKQLYQQVGGMDVDMPYICSDLDFCLKLKTIQKDTWIAANSIVYHKSFTSQNNSKVSNFGSIQSESRTMFYVKNHHRLPAGEEHWVRLMLEDIKKRRDLKPMYYFLNICSYYDIDWYKHILKEIGNLEFYDEYRFPVSVRQQHEIQLYDLIPYSFFHVASPVIYFVDSFLSLKNNDIWFKLRDISDDLIMDINGNVVSMQELAEDTV